MVMTDNNRGYINGMRFAQSVCARNWSLSEKKTYISDEVGVILQFSKCDEYKLGWAQGAQEALASYIEVLHWPV